MELPRPSLEALHAYRDLSRDLSQWAPTVHRLVRERVAALGAAYGTFEHPTETHQQFVQRALAGGQNPFPPQECVYDNAGYDRNNNTGYEHIDVGYGLADEDGGQVTFTGRYPLWSADGESYQMQTASIHCPVWVITEPDGVERYRRQTEQQAQKIREKQAALDRRISDLTDRALRERAARQNRVEQS